MQSRFITRRGLVASTLYLLFSTVAGLIYLSILPPLNTPDARAHVLRAAQIAAGQWFPETLSHGRFGGEVPEKLVAYADALTAGRPLPNLGAIAAGARQQADFSNAAAFPPLAYLPQAFGLAVASSMSADPAIWVFSARLGNLIAFILLSWLAVALVPHCGLTLGLTFLLPFSFSQAATVSADPVNFVVPLILLAYVLRIAVRQQPITFAAYSTLSGLVASLGLLKQTAPAFGLCLFLLYQQLGRAPRAVLMIVGPISIGVAIALTWAKAYPFLPGEYFGRGADPMAQLAIALDRPRHIFDVAVATLNDRAWIYWHSAFGLFPPRPGEIFHWAPFSLALGGLIGLGALGLVDTPRHSCRPGAGILIGVGVLVIAGTIIAFWLAFTAPGELIVRGVQGRYLAPAYGCIFLGMTLILPAGAGFRVLRWVLAASVLAVYLATLWFAASIYAMPPAL